ncbi:hypothetical protein ACFWWC_03640 [Streptomyces sp. NPDC058642]|uniref:hypothetical protein n=1 Tax=Streptomyces sp. NPDC058642 TaxID=3346572 RepID=UPI003665CB52
MTSTYLEAVHALMDRAGTAVQKKIRQALVIPQEPSQLPAPDEPMYELLREQHRVIARMRGRPCGCGSCEG